MNRFIGSVASQSTQNLHDDVMADREVELDLRILCSPSPDWVISSSEYVDPS